MCRWWGERLTRSGDSVVGCVCTGEFDAAMLDGLLSLLDSGVAVAG